MSQTSEGKTLYVYDNWSAYDELSDNVELTEEVAMRQFDEVCRLRRCGVRIDAYLMDAFWYSADGGYLTWRRNGWPHGPDRWLEACRDEGILPGLWFTANTAFHLETPTAWRDSLAPDGWGYSCTAGGFLSGFMGVLTHWYARGVRVFKFDFADFGAGGDRSGNIVAFRAALAKFKAQCCEAVLLAYNGFAEDEFMPSTDRPVRPVMDPRWLDTFNTMYCGDPRPSDLPLPSFWRTLDVYADAMVHLLHRGSNFSLRDIDNCSFMIGRCGTCYRRGAADWRTTALLSYARGGRVHVAMGNLEVLSDDDARWLARVQALYAAAGLPSWVGGNPGAGDVYAYEAGSVVTVVNPSLAERRLVLDSDYRVGYADGFVRAERGSVQLGPGAVAVLLRGASVVDLGSGSGPCWRLAVAPGKWTQRLGGVDGIVEVARSTDLHVVVRQFDADGLAVRTSGGAPPHGKPSSALLRISAVQDGKRLDVRRIDDRIIWSGMSWAYGIVSARQISPEHHVAIRFDTEERRADTFEATAYVELPPAG